MTSRLRFLFLTVSACLVGMLVWGAVVGRGASPDETYRHLAVYTEVLAKIKSDYVEEPDMKNVTLGAVNGLLESLDPFASYLNADQYKQWQKSREEKKADVGLILSKKFGYLGVVDTWPESSAAKAGLNTGDFIETINGVSTRDMPLAYAEVLLRGDPGTTVELSVMRVRRSEPQKITLERTVLKTPKVSAKMLPDQVGYIAVPSTESGKARETASALSGLLSQGAKSIVLDLRNAAYGSAEEGIALANLFLEKGAITYLQGQRVAKQSFEADPSKTVYRGPLVVLTNRGTANGAEVAAAALLDHKRAEVVGERTYGDAAQRKAITMEDGSAVILSVAKYYSPLSAKALQDNGVTPSVPVTDSGAATEEEEIEPDAPEQPRKPGEDLILKRAIEVLTKGAVASAAGPASASHTAGAEENSVGPPASLRPRP